MPPRRRPRSASKSWQRRNARARALGYKSYYDYRAHDYGRLPPGEPRLRGQALARARGHRSSADLVTLLRARRVEMIGVVATQRGNQLYVDALATLVDGSDREFHLNEPAIERVRATVAEGDPEAVLLVGSPKVVRLLTGKQRKEWRFKTKAQT